MYVNNVLSNLKGSGMAVPKMRAWHGGLIIYINSVAAARATTTLGRYGMTEATDGGTAIAL